MTATAAADPTIADVLALRDTKAGLDLRDRLASLHLTGAFPTHLRPRFTSLLRAASRYRQPTAGSRPAPWRMVVEPAVVAAYDLERHPMVHTVRKLTAAGWHLRQPDAPAARRPFGRVLLERPGPSGPKRVTIRVDGSVKEGWPR